MKGLLYLLPILALAASEAPNAPYPASGWRPSGPSFELPQKQTANQQDSFLPGREDQRFTTPASEYGAPEEDHSVQGLPVQEQTPLFMVSPINGQQYVGKDFNKDLRVLQEQLRQLEAQRQRQYSPSSQSDSDQEQEDFPKQQTPPTNTNNPGGSRFDSPRYPQKGINTQLGTTNQPQGNIATQFGKPNNPQSNFNTGFGYNRPQETDTQYDAPRNVQENPNGGFSNPNSPQDNQNRQFLNPSQTQFRFNSPNPGQNPQPNGEASRNNINFRTNVNAQPSDTVTPNNDDGEVSTERTLNETDSAQPKATGVEITQQQLTQLPNPNQLAQLALLQQYSSVPFTQQIGQIQAPIFYQPLPQAVSQNLIASPYLGQLRSGFDPTNPANLAAIQATLAQRQLTLAQTQGLEPSQMAQLMQNQRQLEQAQLRQSQLAAQNQAQFIPTQQQYAQPQYVQQPQLVQNQGFLHPQNQYSNPQGFVQPELLQSQPGFLQPQQSQGGFIQQQQQPQFDQAQSGFVQMQSPYPQIQPQSQMQYPQDQSGFLQSGFNVNQQGNGLGSSKPEEGDIDEEEETDEDFGNSATAVSTSFGKRLPTTPRPAQSGFTRYGTPSAPTQQYGTPQGRGSFAAQAPATTDDSLDENPTTEDVPAVAVANAVADGRRGKPNKLRNRRIRPLFTLDKNGQLVQLQK